jgi:hypothetical protein
VMCSPIRRNEVGSLTIIGLVVNALECEQLLPLNMRVVFW